MGAESFLTAAVSAASTLRSELINVKTSIAIINAANTLIRLLRDDIVSLFVMFIIVWQMVQGNEPPRHFLSVIAYYKHIQFFKALCTVL